MKPNIDLRVSMYMGRQMVKFHQSLERLSFRVDLIADEHYDNLVRKIVEVFGLELFISKEFNK